MSLLNVETGEHAAKRSHSGLPARPIMSWLFGALVAVVVYLAQNLIGRVASLEDTRTTQVKDISKLQSDMDWIRAALLRIENKLERSP